MNQEQFIAEATFHVRYAETDAQGIVHHSSYIIYFEEGRSEYLRKQGVSYADFERGGHFLAVTEVNARYLKSARYDDLLTVRTWVVEARSRTLTFEYEIINAETKDLLLTGYTKHICLNRTGQITRIPDSWQKWVSS